MKGADMKKAMLGFIATAMSLLTTTAQAAVGDIRSIEACNEYGDVLQKTNAYYTVGETVYFRIRLENANSREAFEKGIQYANPWVPKYQFEVPGSNSTNWWALVPPKIGVIVGGKLKYASVAYPRVSENAYWLTDLICSYTVKSGDIALPLILANSQGLSVRDGNGGEYFFGLEGASTSLASPWSLVSYEKDPSDWNSILSTKTCVLKHGLSEVFEGGGATAPFYNEALNWVEDYTLKAANLNLKAVDFSKEIFTVPLNASRKVVEVRFTGGAIDIPEDEPGYVWVRVKAGESVSLDSAADNVLESGIEKMWDGVASNEYQVAKIRMPSGEDIESFYVSVRGSIQDSETDPGTVIYLSSEKAFTAGPAGDLNNDYLTAYVKCGEPLKPSVNLSIAAAESFGQTLYKTKSPTNYFESVAKLTITLSDAYTSDVTVTITPRMADAANSTDPLDKYIALSTMESGDYKGTTTSVVIPAGDTTAVLNVYVRGGDNDTSGTNKGIEFVPTVNSEALSFFTGAFNIATLQIDKSTPEILDPQENEVKDIAGGVEYTYWVQVADDFNNMLREFEVEFYMGGTDGMATEVEYVNQIPDGEGRIAFKVTHTPGSLDNEGKIQPYQSKIVVKNAEGVRSAPRIVICNVSPTKEAYAVVQGVEDGENVFTEIDENGDARVVSVNFFVTAAYSKTLYAFLVPNDSASTNLVECKQFTRGVKVAVAGETATEKATIKLLDGCEDSSPLSYSIVLRTDRDLNKGIVVGGYATSDLELYVENVQPKINSVWMGADADNLSDEVTVSGGTFESVISKGATKTFSLAEIGCITDAKADLNSTEDVEWLWRFTNKSGSGSKAVRGVSPLNKIATSYTFAAAGTYTVTVQIKDKDMDSYGEAFTFNVVVSDRPPISFMFPNSDVFNETDAKNGIAYFDVVLTNSSSVALQVALEIASVGNSGTFKVDNTTLVFDPGDTQKRVYVTELDGTDETVTSGFDLRAAVVTDTVNDDGLKWSDYYIPGKHRVKVTSEAPIVIQPSNAGQTNNVPMNVPVPIKWTVTDVPADIDGGIKIEWNVEGDSKSPYYMDGASGVFTNIFEKGGVWTVKMTAEDKDGERSDEVILIYNVAPSKVVEVFPVGPRAGTAPYSAAPNSGLGRIYGVGARPVVTGFGHKYSYDSSESLATFFAYGYRSGQVDDGNLVDSFGNKGIAIDASGNSFLTGVTPDPQNCFTYSDSYDSFFYAWVHIVQDGDSSGNGDGDSTESMKIELNPENPSRSYFESSISISLPGAKAETGNVSSYPASRLWAYFSREKYAQDNMGDINGDGIPDIYATMKWVADAGGSKTIAEAETGKESSGGDDSKGSESTEAVDLFDVRRHNSDNDFLPMVIYCANPLNPENADWGPSGQKFDAEMEIRGFHKGLNYPGVSEYDLSEAETYALLADCAASGVALTGTFEENYITATNWAKTAKWTPEAIDKETGARLNPLAADTDGDGFDDGWEYYLWYHAKVGAVVNGKWARLEGRRFDPTSPTLYTRIPPEEIVAKFDPHVPNYSGDIDNDGLTDFEEYVLGTNPVCFDLNGDSVPELYKVMNGINPASPFYNEGNPDCDFMARCEYDGDTFTVFTFDNGDIFALPTKTSPSARVIADEERKASVWKVEFVSKEVAYFATLPAVIPGATEDSLLLAGDATGNLSVTFDAAEYLGQTKTFVAGTPVKSVATEAVEMSPAVLDAEGFAWTDPDTIQASRTKNALPLFNYGGDGVTLVPCTTNVTTYALAPADVGAASLIKVETDKKITLIHYQVLCQYGFDPRTAWNIDDFGFVDQRWRKLDSIEEDTLGQAGLATRTAPYTTRDEFLVSQYRREMRNIGEDGVRSATESILNGGYLEYAGSADITYLQSMTTYPNLPVSFIRAWYATRQQISPFENSTNDTIIAYWEYLEQEHEVHGADTDYDGIPDGWELYVNANPNDNLDAKARDGWAKDGDNLNILEEYVGVDSCNAYTNKYSVSDPNVIVYPEVTTITRHNPGKTMNWWNKFFPTNPYDQDTDGDGINDHAEGKGWSTDFYVGNHWYGTQSATFIYGTDEKFAKYAGDGATTCFRGGGLNPCTVDTDGDLLPDAWEAQFAGILFTDGETKVSLLNKDKQVLASADGKQGKLSATGCEIRGGMDGTFSGDACYDFDHDGLVNCQEYLVQSLRHLRYDDCLTPLMGIDPGKKQFINFIKFSAWDGEAFHKRCLENGFPGLGTWQFAELGYFTRPLHEWDMLWQNKSGQDKCKNYDDPGYRVMLPPIWYCADGTKLRMWHNGGVRHYASTDPRRWDSDEDGMDDFWELFHGLNPLLGSAADPLENGEYDWPNTRYDVIGNASGGNINAWFNHWTDWKLGEQPEFDALKYPWMMGTMECDADGDGLRNDEESIKVNLAKPQNTHTDPTPLWMTDSKGAASVTAQYYDPDPYVSEQYTGSNIDPYPDIYNYPWQDMTLRYRLAAFGMGGRNPIWMFSFEENEGYDTDHDFRADARELSHDGINMASDPKNHTDLDRRQALYFPGNESAAVSYGGEFRRSPSTEPDLLKQFTVECWVMADAEIPLNKTILERVCNYGASTLINNQPVIKANFRIGTDGSGRLFGEFEGTTANVPSVRVTAPNELQPNKWTHVAFRFDGSAAYLHIDGNLVPVASADGLGLIPANGIDGIQQEYDKEVIEFVGYRALP